MKWFCESDKGNVKTFDIFVAEPRGAGASSACGVEGDLGGRGPTGWTSNAKSSIKTLPISPNVDLLYD